MPTECPHNGYKCGTINPIWMNGTYPSSGEITNVTACVANVNGGCCTDSYDIQVKNCDDFYIYNLKATSGCHYAYCFGTEVKCPVGETSDNGGFTPGCEFDPCHSSNYDILVGEMKRSSNYTLQTSDVAIEDSRLKTGWYRIESGTGNDIVNESVSLNQCGTVYPLWMEEYVGLAVGVDVEAEGALIVTNPDPADISDRPIQPILTPFAGPYSSNEDILVEDSRDDTYALIDIGRCGMSANETTLHPCNNLNSKIDQGAIPDVSDKTVARKVCKSGSSSSCEQKYDIQVKNCGSYRTYYLTQLNVNESAYCFGTFPVPDPATILVSRPSSEDDNDDKSRIWATFVALFAVLSIILTAILLKNVDYLMEFILQRTVSKRAVSFVNVKEKLPTYEEVIQTGKNDRLMKNKTGTPSASLNQFVEGTMPVSPNGTKLEHTERS